MVFHSVFKSLKSYTNLIMLIEGRMLHVSVLLFLHGAGFSALSWALLAKNISESVPGCFLVAIDLRGHGDSRTADESDFSFETLSEDVCRVYETLVKDCHLPGADEVATQFISYPKFKFTKVSKNLS